MLQCNANLIVIVGVETPTYYYSQNEFKFTKVILLQFLNNKQVCTLRIIMDTDMLIPTRIRNFRIAQE